MNAQTTGGVTIIYIGSNIIHPVALNVGDTISFNISQNGINALYTVNSITGNVGYDALGVTFQTGNYTILPASTPGLFDDYTYCIYPQATTGTQGVQGTTGLQGANGLHGGCIEISAANYISQNPLNPGSLSNFVVAANVTDGGLTSNITQIFLGIASGVIQPVTGLPQGSTITISASPANTTTSIFTVNSSTIVGTAGIAYDVTYVSGLDFSNDGQAHRVCTSTAGVQGTLGTQGILGVQGTQGLQGIFGLQGTSGSSELRREIVKSSFRSRFGLPVYLTADPASSSFRIGGPGNSNLTDGGGWNAAYWSSSTNGGILTGVTGFQDQFTLMGNGIALSKSYDINDQISFRGVFVGQKVGGAYATSSTIGINLYKLKCGVIGDGTNEWETVATSFITTPNVVTETNSDGEGRGRLCINGTFLLDKTVNRFSEYLAVGFATSNDDSESFGGNDIIVSYLLYEGVDPQP